MQASAMRNAARSAKTARARAHVHGDQASFARPMRAPRAASWVLAPEGWGEPPCSKRGWVAANCDEERELRRAARRTRRLICAAKEFGSGRSIDAAERRQLLADAEGDATP